MRCHAFAACSSRPQSSSMGCGSLLRRRRWRTPPEQSLQSLLLAAVLWELHKSLALQDLRLACISCPGHLWELHPSRWSFAETRRYGGIPEAFASLRPEQREVAHRPLRDRLRKLSRGDLGVPPTEEDTRGYPAAPALAASLEFAGICWQDIRIWDESTGDLRLIMDIVEHLSQIPNGESYAFSPKPLV